MPRAAGPKARTTARAATRAPSTKPAAKKRPKAPATGPAALAQAALKLESLHDRLAEALAGLSRAKDYEPLTAPLREFARVSPALAEALRPLGPLAASLTAAIARLEARDRAADAAPAGAGGRDEQLAAAVGAARAAILDAVASLPREPAYDRVAAQLRELATVSPSLMDWLREVPSVAAPLNASVRALLDAAAALGDVEARLRRP